MTATDWPSLAARFEAATDETVYECVRELVRAVWMVRFEDLSARLHHGGSVAGALSVQISDAEVHRLPDLLLGVVVACVPEGMGCLFDDACAERPYVFTSIRSLKSAHDFSVSAEAGFRSAALGAAVCRAWAEVEKGEVADG